MSDGALRLTHRPVRDEGLLLPIFTVQDSGSQLVVSRKWKGWIVYPKKALQSRPGTNWLHLGLGFS